MTKNPTDKELEDAINNVQFHNGRFLGEVWWISDISYRAFKMLERNKLARRKGRWPFRRIEIDPNL